MLKELLTQLFEGIKSDILSEMNELGYEASGRTANSFEIEVGDNYGALIGLRSFQTIVQERLTDSGKGRQPTQNDGNGALYNSILQWIDAKGITPDGITKESLAFLISRKIHREGTKLYRGERQGVDLKGIRDKRIELFLLDAGEILKDNILTNFRNVTNINTET